MTRFLLLAFLLHSSFVSAQDFSKVDEFARNTPDSKSESVEKLAAHLTKEFENEIEKVRAIYVWMAENIRYNVNSASPDNRMSIEQRIKKQQPHRVLNSKKAICEGYSNLFQALCEEAGLRSLIVTGYTKKPDGKIAEVGHAWNVVAVDGKWHLIDITWGAGGVDGERDRYVKSMDESFFLANPVDFVQHHLPHDPIFQLIPEPVEYETFRRNKVFPISTAELDDEGHAQLDVHYRLRPEQQTIATCRRALKSNPENGFCNFTLAKREYELALEAYHAFFDASKKAFDKKIPLTTAMVDGWETYLEEYRAGLRRAENYLENIRSNDPVADAAKMSKDAIRQGWKISRETEAQFREYRDYLAKVGR